MMHVKSAALDSAVLNNWSTKRNIENSTNFKVSLYFYNGMSHKAHNVMHKSNQMKSLDDVTHSTLTVMITVQSKPSRPTRVNYVTMSLLLFPSLKTKF